MGHELFRSDDLLVRRVGERGGTVIVTFGSYTNEPDLDREGFGETFLAREGIDAIHVINRRNHWYQHPETPAALAAVADAVAGFQRAITYGSSMGGYAALRFATVCGARTAIALSPQYSVDPRAVPWEMRWQADVARVEFAEPSYVPTRRAYIFYDPRMTSDDAHVELYAAAGNAVKVPLPYAGHPVGALLAETGALQAAFRAIIAGSFRPEMVRGFIREGRHRSQHLHFLLARRATPRRPELAVRLLKRAAAIEPESHILSAQAVLLDRLGRHAEAAPLHRVAVERTPSNALAWIGYARHLEFAGDHAAATTALREALPGQPNSMRLRIRAAQFRHWLRRWKLGLIDRAYERLSRRIERSPHHGAITRLLGRRIG